MTDVAPKYKTEEGVIEHDDASPPIIDENNKAEEASEELKDVTPTADEQPKTIVPKSESFAPVETLEEKLPLHRRIVDTIVRYFRKWGGVKNFKNPYKRPSISFMIVAFISAFIGIMLVAIVHYYAIINQQPNPLVQTQVTSMLVGSFGASAVLIYGEIKSPLAQPRNFIGGHFFSAITGVLCRLILEAINLQNWFTPYFSALSVATAIVVMFITRTTHPPGGATALIAVTSPLFPWYGFQYIFVPILSGCLIMLIVALVVNNLKPDSHYPLYWW